MKMIDIKEFVELGYLQELNRQFLHPQGLALVVDIDANGAHSIRGIWDARNDSEGIVFSEIDEDKRERVAAFAIARYVARTTAVGSWIQEKNR